MFPTGVMHPLGQFRGPPRIRWVVPFVASGITAQIAHPATVKGNLAVYIVHSEITTITQTDLFVPLAQADWTRIHLRQNQTAALFNRMMHGCYARVIDDSFPNPVDLQGVAGPRNHSGFLMEVENWFGRLADGIIALNLSVGAISPAAVTAPTREIVFPEANNGFLGDWPGIIRPSETMIIQSVGADGLTEEPPGIAAWPALYPDNRLDTALGLAGIGQRVSSGMATAETPGLPIAADSYTFGRFAGWRSMAVFIRGRGPLIDPTLSGGGTTGDDSITGTPGDDTIIAGDGADTVSGLDGADNIDGGGGADSIDAGAGADTVLSGSGDDTVAGGDGGDVIDAGSGADSVTGGTGDDVLISGPGADTLEGGAGADTLIAEDGGNVLTGGADADLFVVDASGTLAATITDFEPPSGGAVDTIAVSGGGGVATGDGTFRTVATGAGAVELAAGLTVILSDGGAGFGVATALDPAPVATLLADLGDGSSLRFGPIFKGPALIAVTDGTDAALFRVTDSDGLPAIAAGELVEVLRLAGIGDTALLPSDVWVNFAPPAGLQQMEIAEADLWAELGGQAAALTVAEADLWAELGGQATALTVAEACLWIEVELP